MSNSGDVVDTDEVQVVVDENDTDVDNATEIAVVNGPYGSIQLEVPDTWEFEICDVDDDRLGVASYGILLKPANETYGIIEVGYCDGFGVCGTGSSGTDLNKYGRVDGSWKDRIEKDVKKRGK